MDNEADQLDFYNPPTVFTVFCDDIRTEVANRYSYIGVYPTKPISLSDLPEKPDKLNMVFFLTSPEKDDILLFVDMHILYNNKTYGEMKFGQDDVNVWRKDEDTINNDETYTYRIALRLKPFKMVAPSTVEVKLFVSYARRGVYELNTGKLQFVD